MQVEWKQTPTSFHKANAQKCHDEIGDNPTPEMVLEIAKNPDTELHKCFEWEDSVAAHKWRLHQARQIIQSFVIKGTENTPTPVRAYQISTEPQVYKPSITFVQNKDEYVALLSRAKGELKAIRNRYKQLTELETIFKEIDAL